jgi:hypothetical protein
MLMPVRTPLHPPSVASEPFSPHLARPLPLPIVSPAASAALSLVALMLAITAIVLATIANRRWVGRDRPTSPPGANGPGAAEHTDGAELPDRTSRPELVALREQLAALGVHVSGLQADVDRLAPELVSLRADVSDVGAGLATLRADVSDVGAGLATLRADVSDVAGELATLRTDLTTATSAPVADPTALRHVALVRYDAFADVGGRLSYSVALLDDTRSGLVLTTLAGKSDVRTYARAISAGAADGTLTAEEQQAIEAAAGPTGSRP